MCQTVCYVAVHRYLCGGVFFLFFKDLIIHSKSIFFYLFFCKYYCWNLSTIITTEQSPKGRETKMTEVYHHVREMVGCKHTSLITDQPVGLSLNSVQDGGQNHGGLPKLLKATWCDVFFCPVTCRCNVYHTRCNIIIHWSVGMCFLATE